MVITLYCNVFCNRIDNRSIYMLYSMFYYYLHYCYLYYYYLYYYYLYYYYLYYYHCIVGKRSQGKHLTVLLDTCYILYCYTPVVSCTVIHLLYPVLLYTC